MKSSARSFGFGQAWLLIGTLTGLMFGIVACADPEGTTPDCVQDVGDGTHQVTADGCNQFAVCLKDTNGDGDAEVVNAEECCKSLTNDYEHAVCLYGYGAGEFPKAP